MRIYIIANFAERLTGKNDGRFEYLADLLVKRGHDVTLITSDFDHFIKAYRSKLSPDYSYAIRLIHEPGYKTNVSLKRLYSHRVWGNRVYQYLKQFEPPDVIYLAVPSLTVGVKTAKYCRVNGIKLIIDVQDLWPEAFCMAIKNPILQKGFLPLTWYVNRIYRSADYIVAVSDTYVSRVLAVNDKADSLSVFLGNDGESFDEGKDKYMVSKPKNEFWLAYIGTLGHSYDIPCVIDAISKLNGKSADGKVVKFVVIGDGPLKRNFEEYAKARGVACVFTGGLPYQEMVGRMCSCDAVMNPIIKGAPQSITNKVGDYALSGLPVISTQENEEYRNLVDTYQCGINCECGNSDEIAKAINFLSSNPKECAILGMNARKLGVERFDRQITYPKIVEAIESLKR